MPCNIRESWAYGLVKRDVELALATIARLSCEKQALQDTLAKAENDEYPDHHDSEEN